MHIVVLGAGAMGCLFGGLLARKGHAVILADVDRRQIDAINSRGLRIESDIADRPIRVPARTVGQIEQAPELLILFTKTMQSVAALESARHLLGPQTWLLTIQNGLGNVEIAAQYLDKGRIIVGMTTFPADLVAFGHVVSHGSAVTHIMTATGKADEFVAKTAEILSEAGLNGVVEPDIESAIWSKVAFNAAMNSLAAVTGATPGTIGNSEHGTTLAREVVAETAAVARAKGIEIDEATVNATIDMAMREHKDHQPSMLQDMMAGRPTEIDSLNGAIVKDAAKVGVTLPVTATLWRLVKLAEAVAIKQRADPDSTHS